MSEQAKLLRQGLVYAAARMAPKAAGFVMLPIYAIYLGKDGYGALSILDTLGAIASILLAQGQAQAQFRLRFKYEGFERRRLQTSIFWYTLGSMLLGLGAAILVGPWLSERYLQGISFFPLVMLAITTGCARSLTLQYTRNLQAQQKVGSFFVHTVGQTAVATIGAIVLVAGVRMGVLGRVVADFVAALLFTFIATVRLRPMLPWRGSWAMVRRSVSFGVPLMWHELANWVNNLSDRLLVNYFIGLSAAGVYAMGYKLASAVEIMGLSLNAALSAQMYRTLKDYHAVTPGERLQMTQAVQGLVRSQLLQVAGLALVVGAFSKEVLVLMSQGEFVESAVVVPLAVAGTLVAGAYRPFNATLAYFDRTRVLPLFSLTAASTNVALNVLLIPRLGMYGAALATLLSNALSFTLGYVVSKRVFQVYSPGVLSRVFAVVGVCLAYMGLIDQVHLGWPLALGLKLVALGAGGAMLLRIAEVGIRTLWLRLRGGFRRKR